MSNKCCCYLHCTCHSRTILIVCDHFFPEDGPSLMSSIMGAVASQKRFVSCSVWWILSSLACSSFFLLSSASLCFFSSSSWDTEGLMGCSEKRLGALAVGLLSSKRISNFTALLVGGRFSLSSTDILD